MKPFRQVRSVMSASNTLTTIANNAGGTIQGAVNALVAKDNASVGL